MAATAKIVEGDTSSLSIAMDISKSFAVVFKPSFMSQYLSVLAVQTTITCGSIYTIGGNYIIQGNTAGRICAVENTSYGMEKHIGS